jgi:transposase
MVWFTTRDVATTRNVTTKTVINWIRDGVCRGAVKLEAKVVGGRFLISDEALQRFEARATIETLGDIRGARASESESQKKRKDLAGKLA